MFKYMSAHVAPRFAKTLQVRFTQPSDLNDPFEFRPLIDFERTAAENHAEIHAKINKMFGTTDDALAMMEKQQATDPHYPKLAVPIQVFRKLIQANPALGEQFMAELQRHKAEMLDNLRMMVVWDVQWEKFQEALGSFGIFSLTEDPTQVLMWSHYGSDHRGMVVEFNERHPWFDQRKPDADEFGHLVQVTYKKDPPPRTWGQLDGTAILYTKSAEWAYEREWRIIRPLQDGTEVSSGIFCFEVPPSAIRTVIFGYRSTPALENEVRASFGANPALGHVRFKRAKRGAAELELIDAG